jgi:hypothetical protein
MGQEVFNEKILECPKWPDSVRPPKHYRLESSGEEAVLAVFREMSQCLPEII